MNHAKITSPALAIYLGLSLLGMLLIFCTQLLQGLTDVNALLLVVGLATLVARFYWLPYAYLAATCFYQMRIEPFRVVFFLRSTDLLFCAGGLLYLIATLRVHALTRYLGPYDARLKSSAATTPYALPPNPRSAQGAASALEFAWLIVMIPVTVLFAQVAGQYLQSTGENQAITLIWLLVGGILVMRALFEFWQRAQMDPETARLFLQENLWQETRGDQDRLSAKLTRQSWFSVRGVIRLLWTLFKIGVTLAVLQQLLELR